MSDTFELDDYVPELKGQAIVKEDRKDFWINEAELFINSTKYGSRTNLIKAMWVAHNLVLEARRLTASESGGNPGFTKGISTSLSAGPVSIQKKMDNVFSPGDGLYALTEYGQAYLRLIKPYNIGMRMI